MTELSEDAQRAVRQVEKLLRLASSPGTSSAEAASATAKAQELLAAYNLNMALIEERSGQVSGKREDAMLKGGTYEYQRKLWGAVADLNFCLYLHWWTFEDQEVNSRAYGRFTRSKKVFQHRVIGRQVNVAATRAMAEYLEQTIERLAMEFVHGDNRMRFSREAVSFREGVTASVTHRIWERRRHLLNEERNKAYAAAEAARASGISTGTELTLETFSRRETEANLDVLMGEGWSARQAAERAEQARAAQAAEEEYTRWAADHPEEAAKREAERRKAERKRQRQSYKQEKPVDTYAYQRGREVGREVSLDQQVDGSRPVARLK